MDEVQDGHKTIILMSRLHEIDLLEEVSNIILCKADGTPMFTHIYLDWEDE